MRHRDPFDGVLLALGVLFLLLLALVAFGPMAWGQDAVQAAEAEVAKDGADALIQALLLALGPGGALAGWWASKKHQARKNGHGVHDDGRVDAGQLALDSIRAHEIKDEENERERNAQLGTLHDRITKLRDDVSERLTAIERTQAADGATLARLDERTQAILSRIDDLRREGR